MSDSQNFLTIVMVYSGRLVPCQHYKLVRPRLRGPASATRLSVSSVARTVVAPPSSVVKCLWVMFVWGVVLVVCVCRCRGWCSLSVCVCVCVCV